MTSKSERLAEIQTRADAATEGPWEALGTGVSGGDHWYVTDADTAIASIHCSDGEDEDTRKPDADFIAHARDDIPWLLAQLRERDEQIAAARAVAAPVMERMKGYVSTHWDDCYKSHEGCALVAVLNRLPQEGAPRCNCAECAPNFEGFRVCGECGNKRCPKAATHRNACTGSNEAGQPGSLYPIIVRDLKKSLADVVAEFHARAEQEGAGS